MPGNVATEQAHREPVPRTLVFEIRTVGPTAAER